MGSSGPILGNHYTDMRLVAIILILLGAVGALVAGVLNSFQHFSDVESIFAGKCKPVRGIDGPADIVIDRPTKRAFIASHNVREKNARGSIHVFDLENPLAASGWRDQTNGLPEDFEPHGLSYFEDGDMRRLFVVNLANNAIERFSVGTNGTLQHLETIQMPELSSPNDIVAIGPRSFYVTNDEMAGRASLLGDLHFLTRAQTGAVYVYDDGDWRVAAEQIRFANGLAYRAVDDLLYVSETTGNAVSVFRRDVADNSLNYLKKINLPAFPDNLSVSDDGTILVAAHPKPLSVPLHRANESLHSPSAVYEIDDTGEASLVYQNGGEEISASSVAARLDDKLIIGALYDRKFLICDLARD